VYDPGAGGHLRVELRALPAGPTVPDMVANAAFLVGATLGLAPDIERTLSGLTFGHARRNFYRAARHGLDAELLWPSAAGSSPEVVPAARLVERLLPVAERGLLAAGVDAEDVGRRLGLIAARLGRATTGARWQRRALDALARGRTSSEATDAMLEHYQRASESDVPVHEWSVP
jgi:gamma-glutamyl:cysteine ligase YbdK (ATP-grasp superfamily)